MAIDAKPGDLAIGIDFGGSGIKGAIVDIKSGQFVGDRIRIATPQPSVPREVIGVMDRLVKGLLEAHGAGDLPDVPVGVGIPGVTRGGITLTAANIDKGWLGFQAEKEMSLAMNRLVVVGNDADVAGLAEVRFGAGRYQSGVTIVLTLGTGVGSAIFIDGKLLPNTEIGHLEMKGKDAEERVADSARDRLGIGWKEWASGFDDYLHMLERLFWPDLFILGGGVSKRTDNYVPYLTIKTPIVPATLRNNAGIVGGALIAHERRQTLASRRAGEPFA